jgi:hypothetical protein
MSPARCARRFGFAAASMVAATLVLTSAHADERRMKATDGGDDARLTEGQLGHADLIGAGGRGEDVESQIQIHLEAARRYMDVEAYDAAMKELEAADRLVPFHEEVMALLETVGNLRDSAREAGMELGRIEEERRARAAREALEREEAQRRARAADEVIARHRLPRNLEHAIVALLDRQRALEGRRADARLARERCIGAAARTHAHGAGRHCRDEEQALSQLRREERALDADLAVLTAAYRERHDQRALDRLLDRARGD